MEDLDDVEDENELLHMIKDTVRENPERAYKLFQLWDGEELDVEYMGGHLLDSSLRCVVSSCNVGAPRLHMQNVDQQIEQEHIREVKRDWMETVTYRTDCPTTYQVLENHAPHYDECPICGHDESFSANCSQCGMTLGM